MSEKYELELQREDLTKIQKYFQKGNKYHGNTIYNLGLAYHLGLVYDREYCYVHKIDDNTLEIYSSAEEPWLKSVMPRHKFKVTKSEAISINSSEMANILKQKIWIVNNKLKSNSKELFLKFLKRYLNIEV